MTGAERRAVSAFLHTAHGFLKRYAVPAELNGKAVAIVAYHVHAVAVGLEAPESNVVLVVRDQTEALRRDVRQLLGT